MKNSFFDLVTLEDDPIEPITDDGSPQISTGTDVPHRDVKVAVSTDPKLDTQLEIANVIQSVAKKVSQNGDGVTEKESQLIKTLSSTMAALSGSKEDDTVTQESFYDKEFVWQYSIEKINLCYNKIALEGDDEESKDDDSSSDDSGNDSNDDKDSGDDDSKDDSSDDSSSDNSDSDDSSDDSGDDDSSDDNDGDDSDSDSDSGDSSSDSSSGDDSEVKSMDEIEEQEDKNNDLDTNIMPDTDNEEGADGEGETSDTEESSEDKIDTGRNLVASTQISVVNNMRNVIKQFGTSTPSEKEAQLVQAMAKSVAILADSEDKIDADQPEELAAEGLYFYPIRKQVYQRCLESIDKNINKLEWVIKHDR